MHTIVPDWPVPARVRAFTTTRGGGMSGGVYATFNLADHVGDDPAHVRANRERLRQAAALPAEPSWLRQVHGTEVVDAESVTADTVADGSYATEPGTVCAVLTADCLPIFLCDRRGTTVAALHAGWRGLATGIVEAGVARLGVPGAALYAWLGPAIGPRVFEVGDDVRDAFVHSDADSAPAFVPTTNGRWLADLYRLARRRLERQNVTAIYGGGFCTVSQPDLFYSYRRDGATGRMASLIWVA